MLGKSLQLEVKIYQFYSIKGAIFSLYFVSTFTQVSHDGHSLRFRIFQSSLQSQNYHTKKHDFTALLPFKHENLWKE